MRRPRLRPRLESLVYDDRTGAFRLRRPLYGAAGALVAIGVLVLLVKWAPQELASTDDLRGKDRAEEIGRVRTALLASLAGLLAGLGAYYTHKTYGLNRAGIEDAL